MHSPEESVQVWKDDAVRRGLLSADNANRWGKVLESYPRFDVLSRNT